MQPLSLLKLLCLSAVFEASAPIGPHFSEPELFLATCTQVQNNHGSVLCYSSLLDSFEVFVDQGKQVLMRLLRKLQELPIIEDSFEFAEGLAFGDYVFTDWKRVHSMVFTTSGDEAGCLLLFPIGWFFIVALEITHHHVPLLLNNLGCLEVFMSCPSAQLRRLFRSTVPPWTILRQRVLELQGCELILRLLFTDVAIFVRVCSSLIKNNLNLNLAVQVDSWFFEKFFAVFDYPEDFVR